MARPERAVAALHLVTGPWGAGKTSLVPHLVRLLPNYVVFDWDLIIPGISAAAGKNVNTDSSAWDGLRATWVAVAGAVLAGGHDVILCGPATPNDFEDVSGTARIRCAYLDCPDDILERRLRARGETDASIADELAYAASLRRSSHTRIPVGNRTPREDAEAVAQWLQPGR